MSSIEVEDCLFSAPRGRRGGRDRRARREVGRDGEGARRAGAGRRTSTEAELIDALPRAAWPTTSARPRSSSATSSPAPPPASSRSSSSARPTGKAATARSTDPDPKLGICVRHRDVFRCPVPAGERPHWSPCWPYVSSRWKSVVWSRSTTPASPSRAGDKVGLIGRNGAGKTSLLRVLAGAAEPYRGRGAAERRSRLPVPGSPRRPGRRAGHRAHPRAVRSRPRRGRQPAREAAPRGRGAGHDAAHVERYSRAEERFRLERRLRRGERSPPPGRRSRSGARPHWTCRSARCRGGERRRVELARILFAGSDVLLLDEPTNHLDNDAKSWLLDFLRRYRGRAARDQPRPRPARRVDHPGAAPRTLRRRRHRHPHRVQGHLQPVPRGREARRRAARPGRSTVQQAEIRRLSTLADVDAPPDPEAGPHGQVARHPGRQARRRRLEVPAKRRTMRSGSPSRPRRSHRARGRGPGQAPTAGRRVRRRRPSTVEPRRAPPRHGAQRRRQDLPAAHPRRRDRARPGHRSLRSPGATSATTRRSTTSSTPARSLLEHMRERADGSATPSCAACSACSA